MPWTARCRRRPLVIAVGAVYCQCSRALHRSRLWDPSLHRTRGDLPTAGQMLKGAHAGFPAEDYDRAIPERVRSTLS